MPTVRARLGERLRGAGQNDMAIPSASYYAGGAGFNTGGR
jgi:hypothetical protein